MMWKCSLFFLLSEGEGLPFLVTLLRVWHWGKYLAASGESSLLTSPVQIPNTRVSSSARSHPGDAECRLLCCRPPLKLMFCEVAELNRKICILGIAWCEVETAGGCSSPPCQVELLRELLAGLFTSHPSLC